SYLVLRGYEEKISYAPNSPLANPDHPIRRELQSMQATSNKEEVANE
ncbi:MAG: 30S ribosomal protein S4, partial [Candidatus Asgardarchaeum californiense]